MKVIQVPLKKGLHHRCFHDSQTGARARLGARARKTFAPVGQSAAAK
jgi:hypothetical protein